MFLLEYPKSNEKIAPFDPFLVNPFFELVSTTSQELNSQFSYEEKRFPIKKFCHFWTVPCISRKVASSYNLQRIWLPSREMLKDLQFDLYIIYIYKFWKIWYVTYNFVLEIFPNQLHVLRWSSFRTFLRRWSLCTKMATRTHQKSQRSPRCAFESWSMDGTHLMILCK